MVGKRDKVHRSRAGHQADVGARPQCGDQRADDGLSRRVAHVENTGTGVGPLQAVGQPSVRIPVKGDSQFPDQQALYQPGPLLRQDADSGGEAQARPRCQNVLGQQVRTIVLPQGDDPPLRVAGVALLQFRRTGHHGDLTLAVARQVSAAVAPAIPQPITRTSL